VVHLLVTERACASGEPATGRVRGSVLEVTATTIRITVGVVPADGGQDCQGNPPTPYVLDLPEPLGERVLVDAGVDPEREIKAPSNSP
jgi:hypothetical protein